LAAAGIVTLVEDDRRAVPPAPPSPSPSDVHLLDQFVQLVPRDFIEPIYEPSSPARRRSPGRTTRT